VPGTGVPRFSAEARAAGEHLGGLLSLHAATGATVRHVGRCPAGAFGVDARGRLVWVADWGWLSSLSVDGSELRLDGRPTDLETGKVM
jgi:hypothetical protein